MTRNRMQNRRRAAVGVEPLEGRALLSGVTPTLNSVPAIVVLPNEPVLQGVMKGTYTTKDKIPDIGRSWTIRATGQLSGAGFSVINGTLNGTGFIGGKARPGGTLDVKTVGGGTMTISLLGTPEAGFSGLPKAFTYRVLTATGRDRADLNATGTATLTLVPNNPKNLDSPGKLTLAFSVPTPAANS
jgi:hypothetical protein